MFWQLISDKKQTSSITTLTVLFLPTAGYLIFIVFMMLFPPHRLHLMIFKGLPQWLPEFPEEIKSHIAQFKKGIVPGADEIPPEFLKDTLTGRHLF